MSQVKSEDGMSRRELVTHLGAVGVGSLATILLAGCGGSSSNGAGPLLIVNSAEVASAFRDIKQDEDDHVAFLVAAITAAGATPRPAPTFSTARLTAPDLNTFVSGSAALENTGTGAYLAAVPLPVLTAAPDILQAAASIALVEGRHAGFLNALKGRPLLTDPTSGDTTAPNNQSREVPQLPDEVLSRAAPFVGTIGTDTNLNGGPPLPTNATIGSATLVDVLNYALFLEYLEKTYYDINVPHFFPG